MNKLKFLFTLALSICTFLVIAGCSGNSSESDAESETESEAASDSSDQEEVTIRFSWWGDTTRNELYNSIVDRFEEENPNITVEREFGGWSDYWDRLATQTAGGNAPDVVSMHQFYVSDYARRGALLNLEDLTSKGVINLENFPQSTIDSGKVGEDLFMVAKGITMSGWAYNTAVFDELGVEYPDMDWTWEDFKAKSKELSEAMGENGWATEDMSGGQLQPNFRYFVRQKGKDLFTEDGQLGFEKEDLVEWWTMWDELRQAGAIPDAATTNEYEGVPIEQNLFVVGKSALHQIPANQIYLFQEQFDEGEVRIVRIPTNPDGKNGEYIEGAYLSITEESKHPEEAAKFIDFFVNSKESLELFKVEQGSPGSTEMAEFVKPLLEPAQQRGVEYIQEAVEHARPAPYAPLGVNEVEAAFGDNASAIAFGEMTIEEAADDFMATAKSILQ